MARVITPINTATDTFNTWVTQANDVIDFVSTEALSANNNANGGFVTGNSQLFGIFTANTIAVYDELRGGNVQSSGTLTIGSDVEQDAKYTWGNSTINAHANSISFNVSNSTASISLIKPTAAQAGAPNYFLAADSTWKLAPISAGAGVANRIPYYSNTTAFTSSSTLAYSGTLLTVGGSGGVNVTAGNITIDRVGDVAGAYFVLNRSSAYDGFIYVETDGDFRWRFGGSAEAESGSDAGTNWALAAYTDAGAWKYNVIDCERKTGDISLSNNLILTNESAAVRVSDSSTNVVVNDTDLTIQNSTVTFVLSKPTAADVADGSYYLNADGTWKSGGSITTTTQCNTAGTAREIDNFSSS